MRPLLTAADRAAAAELIEIRTRWLTDRSLTAPANGNSPAIYRDERSETLGLYEDGSLIGCLCLERQPDLRHWGIDGHEPCLMVSLAHSAPDRDDGVARLMTLWASDFAARLQLPWVRCEAPSRQIAADQTLGRLLSYLRDECGWQILGSAFAPHGDRVARMQLQAVARPSLAPLIHCTVPLRSATLTTVGQAER